MLDQIVRHRFTSQRWWKSLKFILRLYANDDISIPYWECGAKISENWNWFSILKRSSSFSVYAIAKNQIIIAISHSASSTVIDIGGFKSQLRLRLKHGFLSSKNEIDSSCFGYFKSSNDLLGDSLSSWAVRPIELQILWLVLYLVMFGKIEIDLEPVLFLIFVTRFSFFIPHWNRSQWQKIILSNLSTRKKKTINTNKYTAEISCLYL